MKADTSGPCCICMEYRSVARICVITEHGELIDYADLCPLCLRDSASQAGLSVGYRLEKMKPEPYKEEK